MNNLIRTTILLAVMTVFLVLIGQLLGGRQGMFLALILAGGINFFSYWYSDRLVLKMYKAEEVNSNQAPELYGLVRQLASRANLPMPRVYIIPQDTPNAFATGRNPEHAVVAVTRGLLRLLDKDEIMGVLAHELAHVKNRDILIGSIAATMAGAVMMLANMARWSALFGGVGRSDEKGGGGILGLLATAIIAPIAAMLIQMGISRTREYQADAEGAGIMGNSESLARALEKLGAYSKSLPMAANPSTAHMFIVNPIAGRNFANLFSTHPPMEERIARLRGGGSSTGSGPIRSKPSASGGMEDRGRAMWDRLSCTIYH